MDEAMRIWRIEFGPRCPGDSFDKKYSYNVRYNYGKEGRKSDYTPYSCLKIISSQPGQVLVVGSQSMCLHGRIPSRVYLINAGLCGLASHCMREQEQCKPARQNNMMSTVHVLSAHVLLAKWYQICILLHNGQAAASLMQSRPISQLQDKQQNLITEVIPSYEQGQAHGCPYKTWNAPQLTAALSAMRLAPSAVQEAVTKARGGHFQLACAAAFEGVHKCDCDTGINHPNQVLLWLPQPCHD